MRRSPRIEGWANFKTARAGEELVGGGGWSTSAHAQIPRTMKWANRKAARDEEGGTVKLTRGGGQ